MDIDSIPKLNQEYIKQAKLTAFRAENIDAIVKDYENIALNIDKNIKNNKEIKLNKLCELYDDYLYTLGNYVSPWVAGGSNYKKQPTRQIDKSSRQITNYLEVIEKELKEVDYRKNKEKYQKQEKNREIGRLINDIGYFQDINKTLFYSALVELHDLDIDVFIKVYDHMYSIGKINNNSKPAKLYGKIKTK